MDFVAHSAARSSPIRSLLWSYDIACQWTKNLRKRMQAFPAEIQLPQTVKAIRAAIPDFHVIAHGDECQSTLNFLRINNVGRTCGEGIETEWAVINQVATSIREMSPSARQEVLSDHWGFWNWEKIKSFGESLHNTGRANRSHHSNRFCPASTF
jgi:hypothetical protein